MKREIFKTGFREYITSFYKGRELEPDQIEALESAFYCGAISMMTMVDVALSEGFTPETFEEMFSGAKTELFGFMLLKDAEGTVQ